MFESLLASEQANKAAVLLANERFNAQLAPFVKSSSVRLAHVQADVARIVDEVCNEMGADHESVSSRLEEHLTKAILDKDHAKREKLKVKTTPVKNQKEVPATGDIKHTEFDDEGEVAGAGYDEASTPDAKDDLSKDTQSGTFPSERKQGAEEKCECGHGIDSHKDAEGDTSCEKCDCPAYYYDTTQEKDSCFRCGAELHPRVAAVTKVCHDCTEALKKLACDCGGACGGDCDCGGKQAACTCEKGKKKDDSYYDGEQNEEDKKETKEADYPGAPGTIQQEDLSAQTKPVDQNARMQCTFCGFQGNQQEVESHVSQVHQAEMQQLAQERLNNPGNTAPFTASKEAAPADVDEQAVVEPLPAVPGDNFDDMVQDLANRAAAIQFSTLEEKDLHTLAESLGLGPDDLNGQVQVVAVFDNYTGFNGELVTEVPEMPADYQEVQSSVIRATAHEALVPVDIVVQKVAEQMDMDQDLVYNMIKDKYGADLPDKYHAAVQGEYHFYVPASLAVNTGDVAAEQGDIGPTSYAPDGGQPQLVQQ